MPTPSALSPARTEPMYASVGAEVPRGPGWTFEPKFDGIRVLAFASADGVRLVTRNGKDKAFQFPEVVAALDALRRRARRPLVLDGEVVAIERPGTAGRFQALQARMHARDAAHVARVAEKDPAVLVAFDLLQDGARVLTGEPWSARRARLERLVPADASGPVRVSETTPDGAAMLRRARRVGWEGVIAKRTDARYLPGARSRDWLKLKLQHRAEFVVGGWTDPRNSRPYVGALLLGYFDDAGALHYAGHMGGGFTHEGLRAMRQRLDRLARRTPPFVDPPRTNEPAHWVRPEIVVEVKFAEWTADARLRQPIFLGVRDDKPAREVRLERESIQDWAMAIDGAKPKAKRAARSAGTANGRRRATTDGGPPPKTKVASRGARSTTKSARATSRSRSASTSPAGTKTRASTTRKSARASGSVHDQLARIERDGGDGEVVFDSGARQRVTSLDKIYFPEAGVTKGAVMRYYARVADAILPAIADRPLALKRYPEGIDGVSFYQQKAPDELPDGVRVAEVETEGEGRAPRLIGGNLETLVHCVQLGAIAVHAWMSRLRTLEHADFSLIDLDPGDDVAFVQVVELARTTVAVLKELGLNAAVKTSGSSGIHLCVPLAKRTSYETSTRLAERVAQELIERHPDVATMERRINKRPRRSVYVDVQQNAMGKSVVAPYSVREKAAATVSAPLRASELRASLRLQAFTVETEPRRLSRIGDLWGDAMRAGNGARQIRSALE